MAPPLLDVEDPSVAGARRGERVAWADLYERFHPVLRRYFEVVDPSRLDDVVQLWARAARSLSEQPEGVSPLLWLLGLARDAGIRHAPPDDADDPTIRAIRSLDPMEMEVITLRVVAALSEEEVAHLVERPVGRVRAAGHQGLAHLMRDLEAQ